MHGLNITYHLAAIIVHKHSHTTEQEGKLVAPILQEGVQKPECIATVEQNGTYMLLHCPHYQLLFS